MSGVKQSLLSLSSLAVSLLVFGAFQSEVAVGQDTSHTGDEGSREFTDSLRGVYVNMASMLYEGLPTEGQRLILERIQYVAESRMTDEQLGGEMISIATEFASLGYRERAIKMLSALSDDDELPDRVRAHALIKKGEVTLAVDKNFSRSKQCYEDAVALIKAIPAAERTREEGYIYLQSLAHLADSWYCTDMQSDRLPEIYTQILALESEFGDSEPGVFLAMGLDAGRILRSKGRRDEAVPFFESALKHVGNAEVPASHVLNIQMEIYGSLFRWDDPKRIAKLTEMWEDDQYAEEPQIMAVGSDIFWVKFLDRNNQRKDSDAFAAEFIERGISLFNAASEGSDEREDVSKYASQAIIGLAWSHHEVKNDKTVEQHRRQFRELRDGKPFSARFPNGATRVQVREMSGAMKASYETLFKAEAADAGAKEEK